MAYRPNCRCNFLAIMGCSGFFVKRSKSIDSRCPMWSATAVPPTSPKSFANDLTAGRSPCCSAVSISLCMCRGRVVRKIKSEVMPCSLVIIPPLTTRYHLCVENLRDTLNAHNPDKLLDVVPVAVVERRLDDCRFVERGIVFYPPNELARRDKVLELFACHMCIIPCF